MAPLASTVVAPEISLPRPGLPSCGVAPESVRRYRCCPWHAGWTSNSPLLADDGTWTWRAAGAKQPKGVVDGALIPQGVGIGDVVKVEAEAYLEGLEITTVFPPKGVRKEAEKLELLGSGRDEPMVTQVLAPKGRGRGPRSGEAMTAAEGATVTADAVEDGRWPRRWSRRRSGPRWTRQSWRARRPWTR